MAKRPVYVKLSKQPHPQYSHKLKFNQVEENKLGLSWAKLSHRFAIIIQAHDQNRIISILVKPKGCRKQYSCNHPQHIIVTKQQNILQPFRASERNTRGAPGVPVQGMMAPTLIIIYEDLILATDQLGIMQVLGHHFSSFKSLSALRSLQLGHHNTCHMLSIEVSQLSQCRIARDS